MQFDRQKVLNWTKHLGVAYNDIQDKFMLSPARFKIFRAGRRVGKSFTAAKDAAFNEVMKKNTITWIVAPTYTLAAKEFRYIIDFLNLISSKMGFPKPKAVRDNPQAGDLYIETAWGSRVHGKSADRPQQGLVGEEVDLLILSETAMHREETWYRYLRPTLTTRNGRAIFPFTPDGAGYWLYELELSAMNDPNWAVFTCPAWECPHISQEEIEMARRELPEDYFFEQYGGEWRFYTGRVFKSFNSKTHVIEPFPIPQNWKIRAGIDFGIRDATAVIYLAESPTGDFYVIDEYYASDRPTQVHAQFIKEKESRYQNKIVVRVADNHALGAQLMMDWSRHGVNTVSCVSDRKARRDRLLAYLESHEGRLPYHVREAGGKEGEYPRLFFFKGKCPNLIRELLFLRWKEGSRQEGSRGDTEGDDHACDALEYVLFYATQGYFRGISRRPMQYKPRYVDYMTGY